MPCSTVRMVAGRIQACAWGPHEMQAPGENHTFITLLLHSCSTSPPLNLTITETPHEVVVYHSDGLHMGVNDRRTNETESPTLKVLAERIGFVRSRGNLWHDPPPVKLCLSVNETPAIGVEASELFLDFEERACIPHGGFDLHPVSNDPGI